MHFSVVKYERLVKHPTAPFENMRVGVEVVVEDGESVEEAMEMAKSYVDKKLTVPLSKVQIADKERRLSVLGVGADVIANMIKRIRSNSSSSVFLDLMPGGPFDGGCED